MSLSRPATFPLLKLPFLCIEPVIKSWDIFDIIFFALTSKRTRQIAKHLKIPLNGIKIIVREENSIELDRRRWSITRTICDSFFEKYANSRTDILVLRNNGVSLYTKRTNDALMSYTYGNEVTALKLAMEFLNEVFKCSVETVTINECNFPESGNIGVRSAVNLFLDNTYSYAQSQQLSSLLENLEVTDTCTFMASTHTANTENSFFVDPKLFKCRKLVFCSGSATWITRETFLQFEVPRLSFYYCPFSVEDILSFVINWFHSDNNKLEYFDILYQDGQISLENFRTKELNPVPISERYRALSTDSFQYIDFSKGLEIVRQDGLAATIHVTGRAFLFYIWHDKPAIAQN